MLNNHKRKDSFPFPVKNRMTNILQPINFNILAIRCHFSNNLCLIFNKITLKKKIYVIDKNSTSLSSPRCITRFYCICPLLLPVQKSLVWLAMNLGIGWAGAFGGVVKFGQPSSHHWINRPWNNAALEFGHTIWSNISSHQVRSCSLQTKVSSDWKMTK